MRSLRHASAPSRFIVARLARRGYCSLVLTETLYHGAHSSFALHIGQCWTADEDAARAYAQASGTVEEVEIDWKGLTVEWLEAAYDPAEDAAPGDTAEEIAAYAAQGIDVIWYADADERGVEHETYRIVSARALAVFAAARDQ